MQNSLQFPYPFSSFNLASMFDLSSLAAHQNQIMSSNNNNNNNNNHTSNNNHHAATLNGNASRISTSPPKSPNSPQNFDATTAMSHFLFPPSLLAHGFCHITPHEDSCKEKLLKKGVSSKSFTIDSLLGLNNAARAVIQSGIVPSHHHHHHHHSHLSGLNGINLSTSMGNNWRPEHIKQETKKENRYHPYAHGQTQVNNSSNSRQKHSNTSNSSSGTDKVQESSPQAARRAAKAKRVRTIFTPEQLERLEAEFERQQYMVGPERLYLASSLHLTEAQVKVWFQNRRIKWRKQHLEMQQQRLAALRSQQGDMEDEGSSDFGGSSSPTPTVASSCMTEMTNLTVPTGDIIS
ncbi:unnamed protein product [Allacma fusca]|uniref:Homeobox domain-containing protein n=1 Tax=Allacma fusca TaxID=39272 RepID=A0A8J2K2U4_9HEXA|nr:unnamed protein product [Allacma fusca]